MFEKLIEEHTPNVSESAKKTLLAVIDTVFFASLMREEGEAVRVAVIYEKRGIVELSTITDSRTQIWGEDGPPLAWDVTAIARRKFTPRELAKLSKGLKYGTHLAVVTGSESDLWIQGIARRQPNTDGGEVDRIAAPRPGSLIIEHAERELLRFEAGEQLPPSLDVLGTDGPVRKAVGAITREGGSGEHLSDSEQVIEALLRRMRETGAGGLLALSSVALEGSALPERCYRFEDPSCLASRIRASREKMVSWVAQAVAFADADLAANVAAELARMRAEMEAAQTTLDALIDQIGQLSAIDGAILAGPGLSLYAFGYMVEGKGQCSVERAKDIDGVKNEPHTARFGARHNAAITFAQQKRGNVAFVVSEDGPISCAMMLGEIVVVWPVRIAET